MPETIGTPLLWTAFLAGIVVLLVVDLAVFHRKVHEIRFREAMGWSIAWVALSLTFNLWIYLNFGRQVGLEFLTGYVIEKALSIDNIFVFVIIFQYFAVPRRYQHRVLFWGVLGAIVLRALFIGLGTALLVRFHWVLLVFGAFLVFSGVRILGHDETEIDPGKNPLVRFFKRFVPLTEKYHGRHFFTRIDGRSVATPLMLVLVVVEATDVVFAVDSIPAIFGITLDPFIVFTSNILAVLGLRAMYFVLASVMDKFQYLNVGLGLVLVFVGAKMLAADFVHVPVVWSLAVVSALLGGSVLISWLRPPAADEGG